MASGSPRRVRLRNCDYALTGSINMEGKKPLEWRLPPDQWVTVPEEVYQLLKHKFAEVKYTDVPSALPDSADNYTSAPGSTRREQNIQYVIEFST